MISAKFMDARLRSANKEASDEQLDQLMNKVITLFRFIQGESRIIFIAHVPLGLFYFWIIR